MNPKMNLILMTVLLSSTFVSASIYSQSLQQSNSQFGNLKTPSYSKSILERRPNFLRFGLCVTAGALVTAFFDKSAAFSLILSALKSFGLFYSTNWLLTRSFIAEHFVFPLTQFTTFLRLPKKNSSEINSIVQKIVKKCALKHKVKVYVVNTNGCNANTFCSSLGPLGFTAITVTRGLITKFSKKEFEAVVAHECAHILYEDSVCGTVMDILLMCISKMVAWDDVASPAHIPMMTFVLLREVEWLWEYLQNGVSRNQEYRADEFAAIVIGERYAISMLQKLEPIHRFKFLQNLGEYIAQIFEHKCTYPTTSNRIKAIRTSSYSPFIRWG